MTRVARLGIVGYTLAAVIFVAGYGFIPTRVSFGAGSLRCGTALHPDRVSEIRDVCPHVGRHRLEDTVIITAVFALAAAIPLPFHRWLKDRPMGRSLVTAAVITFWLSGILLALAALTRAYGPPGV